jgi:heme-degrading monooxygenase HmoA
MTEIEKHADVYTTTTVIDPEAKHVTIINTYAVEPERADELIAFLIEGTLSTMRHVPGFVSANLHVAHDRTQVVNYAQWKSLEALSAVRGNPQAVALVQGSLNVAKGFTPIQYELRACIPAAS